MVDAFVSVYVDMAASAADVRAAVAAVPVPDEVVDVVVDDRFIGDTFGCRIAVELVGTFDEGHQGLCIARGYAQRLSAVLGVPAFPLFDLLRLDQPERFMQ
ncbi:putative uncharacterized protein [Mycolicibacterium novocastrense]|uniref:Uncharacterized protein n=1 Tax=Mycolicibacterium novocastrense TaxID=59813 RepID=A0ABQ0KE11_MYCNV|nr:putative uncharacterized protein [Mycolicibacterium novocastrense]